PAAEHVAGWIAVYFKMASRIRNVFSIVFRLFIGGMNHHRFEGPCPTTAADGDCLAGSDGFFPFRRFVVAAEAKLDIAIDRFVVVGAPAFELRIPARFGFDTGEAAPDSYHRDRRILLSRLDSIDDDEHHR